MPPETSQPPTRSQWRDTLRTIVVAGVALLPILPELARASGVETVPVVVGVLAVAAAVQRVLAVPAFRTWARKYAPWNWTTPTDTYTGRHRKD
ncbi:hypothetical protein ACYB2S_07350 [Corynebacterium variabile]|uniref:hypothetical protein n=1 Tax=Corynebacterium variabile TaxID=1727 RepID=UPI003CB108CD